jgi:CTP synthase
MKNKKVKFIFVTGGVCSSLGKGVSIASLALLLEGHGYKLSIIKMDPYINIDPGTMSPYQHGEVYVTDDGAETDLDLGYYERFTSAELTKKNSVSTGQIYNTVIQRERKGDYLGRTVQVIPHITNEIKKRIYDVALDKTLDFVMIEIGGTVGDIESIPFLEAIRQMRHDLGPKRVLNVHLTLIPTISVAGEQKTKPTQHSVKELMEIGIIPDILLCRTSLPLAPELKKKIALFCNVSEKNVISAEDIKGSIYEIPYMFHKNNYDKIVLKHFNLKPSDLKITKWDKFIKIYTKAKKMVKIAVVGKYIALQDSYRSIYEALLHGAVANKAKLEIIKIDPEFLESLSPQQFKQQFKRVDGILVPGGFGDRGIEGKIKSITYAREEKIPFFGICLGMQCAVIEFGRKVCQLPDCNSTEFNPGAKNPVISLLEEQEIIIDKGGTMRLGASRCEFSSQSKLKKIYNTSSAMERHRHRLEFTIKYKKLFESKGMIFGGIHPENNLIEAIELPSHPWYIATQYHPEFKSKPIKPHPLFKDFIRASLKS